MLNKKNAIIERLNSLYFDDVQRVKKLPLSESDKYVVFSDLHLGNGGTADNFVHNKSSMVSALKYYLDNDFSIILLGDIEEFWQFDYNEIRKKYDKSIYELLKNFPDNKVHRVYGNHDKEWAGLFDPISDKADMPFGDPEGILLDDYIFLVHGHQGDILSEKKAWSSRFWVRNYRKIEHFIRMIGSGDPAATKSQIPKEREKVYYEWAKTNKKILICGHTHRAIFASRVYYGWLNEQIQLKQAEKKQTSLDKAARKKLSKKIKGLKARRKREKKKGRDINPLEESGKLLPCYFNTGSGVYSKGITSIEIEKTKIRLIKWYNDGSPEIEKYRKSLWQDDDLIAFKETLGI